MSDADDIVVVEQVLQSAGLHVERVAEATTRRCDFRADDARERYLIEVKGFHEAKEAISGALRKDNLYTDCRSFDLSNIDAAIHKAVRQFQETSDRHPRELRIVCLLSRDKYDADLVLQQILGELYGRRSLIGHTASGASVHHECLYFAESAFFRYRQELDAAIIIDADGCGALYLNDYGSNIDRVRKSALAQYFSARGVFYDKDTWERREGRLVADCEFDRRTDVEQVLRYVEQKYGLGRVILMEFHRYSAMAAVPWTDANGE